MGSRCSFPPIHRPPQPSHYLSMNAMYTGSPFISSAHVVGSADASCNSCQLTFTDCLIDFNLTRFTSDNSCPSTLYWLEYPLCRWDYNSYVKTVSHDWANTLPLRIIYFSACKIFHIYQVLVQCTFLLFRKFTLEILLLFPTCLCPFPILLLILGLGCHILLLTVVWRLCVSH